MLVRLRIPDNLSTPVTTTTTTVIIAIVVVIVM